jgi:hypothetical protein
MSRDLDEGPSDETYPLPAIDHLKLDKVPACNESGALAPQYFDLIAYVSPIVN